MAIALLAYAESLKRSAITLLVIESLYKPVRVIRVIAAWCSGISYKVEQQPPDKALSTVVTIHIYYILPPMAHPYTKGARGPGLSSGIY